MRATLERVLRGNGVVSVHAWMVVAAAEDLHRREAQAVEALSRALDIAGRARTLLPLLSPDRHLATSLRRHLELVGTHRDLVGTALASSPGSLRPPTNRPGVPLTGRELAVLLYLPTMRSNVEMAEVLFVSENTVKQHLKSIYRKLSATSRREAVRIARDAGLLSDRRGDE